MVNTFRMLAYLPLAMATSISDKVAELTIEYCVNIPNLTEMDPADAEVVHFFVGDNNLVAKVGACMYEFYDGF